MKYTIEEVIIARIKPGDIIMHEGEIVTVTSKDIKFDLFIGKTIFGDSYHAGHKKVKRLNINGGGKNEKF